MQRRDFITTSALAISAMPLYGITFQNKPKNLAIIGTGWWGMNILREAMAFGDCTIVGLCDVDRKALEAARDEVKKVKGDDARIYEDYRELISKEKPDLVIVASPDHWHALQAIEAIKSGAHVFMEKPISHTINEGIAIFNAARKYDRVVQVDTHRRLSPHNISAMEFLHSGKVGNIHHVKAFVNYNQGPGTAPQAQDVPAHLNWDMYLGPAPKMDYNPGIHPKGFRNHLDLANGTIGDWGIHWFDQVLWWTEEKYPKKIYSTGSRYVKQDGTNAPDFQSASFEFESFTLDWEHRLFAVGQNEGHNLGCYFYGTEGTFHLGWLDGWTFYPRNKNDLSQHVNPELNAPDSQNIKQAWADFRQSIDKGSKPACDIEYGMLATNVSLLGMASYKLGRSIIWDGEKNRIVGDEEANGLLKRDYRGEWEYPV